jgi:AraC family transcriptional regulator of arabinose operon
MLKTPEGFPGQRLIVVPPAIIVSALRKPICLGLFPTHIGTFQSVKGHFVKRQDGNPEAIIIVCLAGQGTCRFNGREWYLKPGHLIVIPKKCPHSYEANNDNPWTIFWFHVVGDMFSHYLEELQISENEPIINIPNISGLMDAFEDVYQHTESGYTNTSLLCLSTSLAHFLGICKLYQRSIKVSQQGVEKRIEKTVEVMKKSLHRLMTLDQLAEIAGWSPTHYAALFKRMMNVPPLEFFTRLKMQSACEKLKLTHEPIQTIASSLGYNDAFYFSRLFKRHNELSPKNYRKTFSLINSMYQRRDTQKIKSPEI